MQTFRDREKAKDYCKAYLRDYLISQGVNVPDSSRKNFRCIDPSHHKNGDANPSMTYYPGKEICHCHAADKSYDIFDACQVLERCDRATAFEKIYSFCNVEIDNSGATPSRPQPTEAQDKEPPADFSGYVKQCVNRLRAEPQDPAASYVVNYLFNERGITPTHFKDYLIGYDPARNIVSSGKETKGQKLTVRGLVFGNSNKGYNFRNIEQNADPSDRYRKGYKQAPAFFNAAGLYGSENRPPLIVTEGEIDAITFIEAGADPLDVMALCSLGNRHFFIEELKRLKAAGTLKRAILLALDNDEPGKTATNEIMAELLGDIEIYNITSIYSEHKDANELWQSEDIVLRRRIKTAQEQPAAAYKIFMTEDGIDPEAEEKAQRAALLAEYKSNSAAGHLKDFLESLGTTTGISTGFADLDRKLGNGLHPGLYTLGAVTSVGKTTLALQIADNIAKAGEDVLIFSLEMSRHELMAKSISRLTYADKDPEAKTTRAILDDDIHFNFESEVVFETAIEQYEKFAENIFIYEGVGDIGTEQIKEEVRRHIDITGRKPVVFVDYLQILSPNDPRLSDKQNTDRATLELKRLSRDCNITVFAVSAFNRESYKLGSANNGKVNITDFKESGAIEYGSDVLIGMEFSAAGTDDYSEREEKQKDIRQINVVIMKNRNGKAWQDIAFTYNAMFNTFEENEEATNSLPPRKAPHKSKRDRERDKLNSAYYSLRLEKGEDAIITIEDMAEAMDCKQSTVTRNIKEYGGFKITDDGITVFDGTVNTKEISEIN